MKMKNKKCDCPDWEASANQIFNAQSIHSANGIKYTGEVFKFCPWCGKVLNKIEDPPITKFSDLALGAKFTYPLESTIWVKISPRTVAQWIENMKDCGWMGQPICSFDENDNTSLPVDVL